MKTAKISGIISAASSAAYLIGSSAQAAGQQGAQRIANGLSYDPTSEIIQEKAAEFGTHGLSSAAAMVEAQQVIGTTAGSAVGLGGSGGSGLFGTTTTTILDSANQPLFISQHLTVERTIDTGISLGRKGLLKSVYYQNTVTGTGKTGYNFGGLSALFGGSSTGGSEISFGGGPFSLSFGRNSVSLSSSVTQGNIYSSVSSTVRFSDRLRNTALTVATAIYVAVKTFEGVPPSSEELAPLLAQ